MFVLALTLVGCGLGEVRQGTSTSENTPTPTPTPTPSPSPSPTAAITLSSLTPPKNSLVTATITNGPASVAFVLTIVSSNLPATPINGTPIAGNTDVSGSATVTFNAGSDTFEDIVTVQFSDSATTTITTRYTTQ